MKLERPLDSNEIRVLGCLLEKQQITPDVYPLTLNALRAAANQSTNRDPVMSLDDDAIEEALSHLQEIGLVWKVIGGRAIRWDHNLDGRWLLTPESKALVTLLLLRGPQTPGELRARSERMARFESVSAVESLLSDLSGGDEPLARELPRKPGQKEGRWAIVVGDLGTTSESGALPPDRASLGERLSRVEAELESLRTELQELRQRLGDR